MVYNLYSDGIEFNQKKPAGKRNFTQQSRNRNRNRITKSQIQTESLLATILIQVAKFFLILYDLITLPIYFLIQRPDLRVREALKVRSERIDSSTWMRTDSSAFSCVDHGQSRQKFMGSTINVIFNNAINEHSSKPCSGYRALVSCPVLTQNDEGQHVLQEKSFRSDYTWYTYEQIGRRVHDIASGLNNQPIEIGLKTKVLFFANTSLEWFLASQACYQLGAILVVAPEINELEALIAIIKESKISVIFTSCDRLQKLSQLMKLIENLLHLEGDENLLLRVQVKSIVLIDWLFSIDLSEPTFEQIRDPSQLMFDKMISFGQIEVIGVEKPTLLTINHHLAYSIKPNDLAMIVYSYGKLGQMKAVKFSQAHLAKSSDSSFLNGILGTGSDVIHCTTLGLDNLIEFMTELCVFCHGGLIGYSSSVDNNHQRTLFYDGRDLFEKDLSDLEALKPSFLLIKPNILESFRDSIVNYLNFHYNPIKHYLLINLIYNYKKYWLNRNFKTPLVDRIFCLELKKLFGNRIKFIISNGSIDCSETNDFFSIIVNLQVIELYSIDETMISLISVNDIYDYKLRIRDNRWFLGGKKEGDYNKLYADDDKDFDEEEEDFPNIKLMPPKEDKNVFKINNSKNLLIASTILCPILDTRIKLENWEDFKITDLPYPRGRMLIGGNVVCDGYFGRSTNSMISNFYKCSIGISWFRTDNIVRAFPNGCFEIISGLTDIIKMSDGQFISLSQIEHILRNSQFVDNVCAICGDNRKFIIALIVPNLRRLALKSPGQANLKLPFLEMEPELEELADIEFRREVCNDRLLCEFMSKHLNELIVKFGFHNEEIPSYFHLVPEIWLPGSELITSSFEPKRNAIQSFYATDIQSIIRMEFRRSSKRLSANSRLNNCRQRATSNNRLQLRLEPD